MRQLLWAAFALAGCGGSTATDVATPTADTATPGLAVVGQWFDDFGTMHDISEDRWQQQFGGYAPLIFHKTRWDLPEPEKKP